jgi:hypothetical protein
LRTVKEIRRRLKPGAPFVAVHSSFPQEKDARAVWCPDTLRMPSPPALIQIR